MTPTDKNILKSLVAFAWVDGQVDGSESEVIDHMLDSFDATDDDRVEIHDFAKEQRSLADIPLNDLSSEDRELLLCNAAVLVRADGTEDAAEKNLLDELALTLGYDDEKAQAIIKDAEDGAVSLRSSALVAEAPPMPPSKRGA